MEKISDKNGSFAAVFDCLSHDLLIAELYAYGDGMASLKLIYTYLCGRKQRIKINDKYSSWKETSLSVLGSILGLLLFNVFVCDKDIDIDSYADDSTLYAVSSQKLNALVRISAHMDLPETWKAGYNEGMY